MTIHPWLTVIGIGEDGMDGLSAEARGLVENAEIIIGGDRHHKLSSNVKAERVAWPSPFDAMIDKMKSYRGRRIVVLVTGDPLWYSVGARLTKAIPAGEIRFFPQLSAFQWASCRMGWSIPDIETLTVHGRADSQILPFVAPGVRMILLTQNAATPPSISSLLTGRGFGQSRITALAALGGPHEKRFDGTAESWDIEVPDFHVLAIECVAGPDAVFYPRGGGLPDEAFAHDGQLTKQDVRATTLAKLCPYADALLWDVGAGCGSVGIDWMRAARGARAIAIEPNESRREMIADNARNLGTEKIEIIAGEAPEALAALAQPDAIFIGGGLTQDGVFEACWQALHEGGRLVANAVTLESEARLAELHDRLGGELVRISVQKAEPIGNYRGWRAAMPVTQWCVVKRGGASR